MDIIFFNLEKNIIIRQLLILFFLSKEIRYIETAILNK